MEKQSAGGGGGSGGDAEVSGLRCVEEFLGSPKEVLLWPAGRPGGPGVSARRLGALGTDSSRPCSSSRRMLDAVILEPRKIKSDAVSTVSPSISHEVTKILERIGQYWLPYPSGALYFLLP